MKSILQAVALLCLILSYQNCSRIGFQGKPAEANSAKLSDDTSSSSMDSGRTPDDESSGDDTTYDVTADCSGLATIQALDSNSSEVLDVQDQSGQLDYFDLGRLGLTNLHGSIRVHNVHDLHLAQELHGDSQMAAAKIETLTSFTGSMAVTATAIDLLENGSGRLEVGADHLGTLVNHNGNVCVHVNQAETIQNVKGALHIEGDSAASPGQITLVLDTQGPLYLKNVTVQKLQNHKGPVYLENAAIIEQLDVK